MEIITKADALSAGFARYFTGVACANGHVSERYVKGGGCTQCVADGNRRNSSTESGIDARLRAHAKYRSKPEVKSRRAEQSKEYASRPEIKSRLREQKRINGQKPEQKERNAKLRSNPARKATEKLRQSSPEYKARKSARAKERRSDPAHRANVASYMRGRRSDPFFAMVHRLRSRCRGVLKAKGYKKRTKTEEMLGAPLDDCLKIIEKQFLPSMGWHNKNLWHLDHIIPLASAESVEHLESLCRISNIRPMWAVENQKKSSKILSLL